MRRGVTNPVLAIFFQLILAKGNILAYFSFLEKNRPMKREFTFNAQHKQMFPFKQKYILGTVMESKLTSN